MWQNSFKDEINKLSVSAEVLGRAFGKAVFKNVEGNYPLLRKAYISVAKPSGKLGYGFGGKMTVKQFIDSKKARSAAWNYIKNKNVSKSWDTFNRFAGAFGS